MPWEPGDPCSEPGGSGIWFSMLTSPISDLTLVTKTDKSLRASVLSWHFKSNLAFLFGTLYLVQKQPLNHLFLLFHQPKTLLSWVIYSPRTKGPLFAPRHTRWSSDLHWNAGICKMNLFPKVLRFITKLWKSSDLQRIVVHHPQPREAGDHVWGAKCKIQNVSNAFLLFSSHILSLKL